jgi:hypothetical protein
MFFQGDILAIVNQASPPLQWTSFIITNWGGGGEAGGRFYKIAGGFSHVSKFPYLVRLGSRSNGYIPNPTKRTGSTSPIGMLFGGKRERDGKWGVNICTRCVNSWEAII